MGCILQVIHSIPTPPSPVPHQPLGTHPAVLVVLAESTLLSLAGGILGVGIALITLKLSSLSVGAEAVTVAFIPSFRLAGIGLLLALVTGMGAGVVPAWYASRTEIVPALRSV